MRGYDVATHVGVVGGREVDLDEPNWVGDETVGERQRIKGGEEIFLVAVLEAGRATQ